MTMAFTFLESLSALFGWVYFLSWSLSFYPQLLLNWKRRSTSGTTIDFHIVNVEGKQLPAQVAVRPISAQLLSEVF